MIIIDPRGFTPTEAGPGERTGLMHLDIEPGNDRACSRIARESRPARTTSTSCAAIARETFESGSANLQSIGAGRRVWPAARTCGVAPERIHEAARWIAAPKQGGHRRRTLLHYEKGLIWGLKNYENIAAIVGLGLLGGNVGKPGTGISRLGGHQEAYVRPPYPGGRPALNVDESVRRGEAKVFWVGGCNPVLTTLRAEAMERALEQRGGLVTEALLRTRDASIGERVSAVVEAMKRGGAFILVQDIYHTATARHAHLVLPASQWGEMNLTSINGERGSALRTVHGPPEAIRTGRLPRSSPGGYAASTSTTATR